MSYFATTVCPKCGKETSHHLGGWGFYGQEKTTCTHCGYTYASVENCRDMEPDRDDSPVKKLQSNRLANFSTEELEAELKKRRH